MNFFPASKAMQYGHSVYFKENRATVTAKDGVVILRAQLQNNLLLFSDLNVNRLFSMQQKAVVWYNRYGHLNF